jgi:hypothetical protein
MGSCRTLPDLFLYDDSRFSGRRRSHAHALPVTLHHTTEDKTGDDRDDDKKDRHRKHHAGDCRWPAPYLLRVSALTQGPPPDR